MKTQRRDRNKPTFWTMVVLKHTFEVILNLAYKKPRAVSSHASISCTEISSPEKLFYYKLLSVKPYDVCSANSSLWDFIVCQVQGDF